MVIELGAYFIGLMQRINKCTEVEIMAGAVSWSGFGCGPVAEDIGVWDVVPFLKKFHQFFQ